MNAVTAAAVDGLFARNERVACLLDDGQQPFAMVLVGALFVGSISTVWHGEITPPTRRQARELAIVAGRAAPLARRADGLVQHGIDRGAAVPEGPRAVAGGPRAPG